MASIFEITGYNFTYININLSEHTFDSYFSTMSLDLLLLSTLNVLSIWELTVLLLFCSPSSPENSSLTIASDKEMVRTVPASKGLQSSWVDKCRVRDWFDASHTSTTPWEDCLMQVDPKQLQDKSKLLYLWDLTCSAAGFLNLSTVRFRPDNSLLWGYVLGRMLGSIPSLYPVAASRTHAQLWHPKMFPDVLWGLHWPQLRAPALGGSANITQKTLWILTIC